MARDGARDGARDTPFAAKMPDADGCRQRRPPRAARSHARRDVASAPGGMSVIKIYALFSRLSRQ